MTELEKIAQSLRRFNPTWSVLYRDMCCALADDMELGGAAREKFLREAKAFEQ